MFAIKASEKKQLCSNQFSVCLVVVIDSRWLQRDLKRGNQLHIFGCISLIINYCVEICYFNSPIRVALKIFIFFR